MIYRAKYVGSLEHLQGKWAICFPRTSYVKAQFEDGALLMSHYISGFDYDDFDDWQVLK